MLLLIAWKWIKWTFSAILHTMDFLTNVWFRYNDVNIVYYVFLCICLSICVSCRSFISLFIYIFLSYISYLSVIWCIVCCFALTDHSRCLVCENSPVNKNNSDSDDDRCVTLLHLTLVINICEFLLMWFLFGRFIAHSLWPDVRINLSDGIKMITKTIITI